MSLKSQTLLQPNTFIFKCLEDEGKDEEGYIDYEYMEVLDKII